jgi:hypothetical protein
MKTILILAMTIVVFAALSAMNDLPLCMVNYGITPCYAMGPKPGTTDHSRFEHKAGRSSVPEPSSLMLMGGGVVGVGLYLFIRNRSKRK